jgi:hypothetical protein
VTHCDFVPRKKAVFHKHWFVSETFLQFTDNLIADNRNPLPETYQAADPVRVFDFVQTVLNHTMNKQISRKKRLHHSHNPSPRSPLQPQPGMKYFEVQVLAQVRGGDGLMLRLRACAVPGWTFNLHSELC